MTQIANAFLQKSVSLLMFEYWPKIEQSLNGLKEEDIWWRANDASSSLDHGTTIVCKAV